MKRKRILLALSMVALTCALAWAATATILSTDGVTGGGVFSGTPSLRMIGAIDGFGLPDGYAAISQGDNVRLEVGQQAAQSAPAPYNAADPAWLRASAGLE